MRKRGSVELAIFLVFIVIAVGGVAFLLIQENKTVGMTPVSANWGAAYIPIVPGPGDLHYNVLQCQAQCSARAIEEPRIANYGARQGGTGYQQCLAWCRNQWRVAAEQVIPGQYDIDHIRVMQQGGPQINYPYYISGDTGIPRVTRDNRPPVLPRSQII
jgi:hypothetical protein